MQNYKAFFEEAREHVVKARELSFREAALQDEEAELIKELNAENKVLADKIALSTKKRRQELSRSYDDEIAKTEEAIKKLKQRREKAKNQGMKERIEEETSGLKRNIKAIRLDIKDMFRVNKISFLARNRLYYTFFIPKSLSDFLTILVFLLVFFAALPLAIYYFLPQKETIYLIVIYLVELIVFGLLYLIISNITKTDKHAALANIRLLYDGIDENNKKIKKITKNIKKDKNDTVYNLASYDDEISHLEKEAGDVAARKVEALDTFDTVTKDIISDELYELAKPKLDSLNLAIGDVNSELKAVSQELKEENLYISENYEVYLGKEFLSEEKIIALSNIMDKALVSNISEAIEEYKNSMEDR